MKKIKRKAAYIFCVLASVFVLSVSGIPKNAMSVTHAVRIVYVTMTDSWYHPFKCGSGIYIPVTYLQALLLGKTPCPKCFSMEEVQHPEPTPTPAPKPVKINKTSIILVKGKTFQLELRNAASKISWSSSKKSVASVSRNGKVTGRKKGKAVITAKIGRTTKKCRVTVEEPKLNAKSLSMDTNQTKQLKLSGCKHSVKWSTSDSSVARVSKGKVIPVELGSAKITATVHGKKYSCKVTVKKPKIQKIVLSETSIGMVPWDLKQISFYTVPKDALYYYDFTVKSSNPSVAEASNRNQVDIITIQSDRTFGQAEISVSGGGVTAKCNVTVDKPVITDLKLSETDISLLPGVYGSITIDTTPFNAKYYYEPIWKSGNENVATVSQNSGGEYAHIRAVGEGETDVTLTLGNKTATCHVVVRP